ncbi:MAG TPA: adenylyl-sulfate kinase [Anaeromyxobacter sp.]|nr:adenylyl-sulfate kinase [Anaeromyxobacter sp.]
MTGKEALSPLDEVLPALVDLAESSPLREVCGLVLESRGEGALEPIPVENEAEEPARAFQMNPLQVLRILRRAEEEGRAVVAIYHSHPDGRPSLSRRDLAEMTADGSPLFPGVDLWVLGLWRGKVVEVRAYRFAGSGFVEAMRRTGPFTAGARLSGRASPSPRIFSERDPGFRLRPPGRPMYTRPVERRAAGRRGTGTRPAPAGGYMDNHPQPGFIVWLTGMNRAGKSTLASLLSARLASIGRTVELFDEDGAAKLLLEGLGPGKDDHARAVARLGYVARAVMRAGGVAVCAALSPYRDARETLRREARRFLEVFVDCGMEELVRRDAGGIYKRALAGELKEVPGVDVPYEPPVHADVTVHTDQISAEESVRRVYQAMVDARYIAPVEFGRLTGGQRPRRSRPKKSARGGARRDRGARAAARKAPRRANLRGAKAAKRRR